MTDHNHAVSRNKQRRGIALLIALFALVILFLLGTAYLSAVLSEAGIARNQESGEKALYLAEAGLERALRVMTEDPDAGVLPWTLQENMTNGYYRVTAEEATDIGDGFVRIISYGYSGKAQRICELVVYLCAWKYLLCSNTDITFTPTALGTVEGDIHANNSVLGISAHNGLYYEQGSRSNNSNEDLVFTVQNDTGRELVLTAMSVTWTSPTAYYTQVTIDANPGTNYGTVWDRWDNGGTRANSGLAIAYRTPVRIASGGSADIRVNDFKQSPTNATSPNVDMDNTAFSLTFWENTTAHSVSIPLAGTTDPVQVNGEITEGSAGDPLVQIPVVDLAGYRSIATQVITGDFLFDGYDAHVDRLQGNTAIYKNAAFYITGKATLNTFYRNLQFRQSMITAEGGIDIVNRYIPLPLDYVTISRQANTNEDVIFQIQNSSAATITLTHLTVDWAPPPNNAAYEYIEARLADAPSFTRLWSFSSNSRAGRGQKITFSVQFSLAAGAIADFRLLNFCQRSNGGGYEDMDNETFTLTYFAGTTTYPVAVLLAGQSPTPNGGNLYFRRWRPQYPTLVTKTGDIIERDSSAAADRDFDGIIYSEQGTVDFENLRLDGCIVADRIIFSENINLIYVPRMIPDPPPFFMSGMSFMEWMERY
ncbi:MAG: pilus assembly PilX N-terminal domain-containing protein [Candidatus Omnitrophica bacterium]|nr:pilus assembly PilX N-terminal domain-containing protein [Candidatus Omnitrophota bacterium]